MVFEVSCSHNIVVKDLFTVRVSIHGPCVKQLTHPRPTPSLKPLDTVRVDITYDSHRVGLVESRTEKVGPKGKRSKTYEVRIVHSRRIITHEIINSIIIDLN